MKGGVLHVRMPRHWPRSEKEAAIARFTRWAVRRAATMEDLPPAPDRPPMSEAQLLDMVLRLNARTLRVPITGVRIGHARLSRLAQANWQTGILTFSRFAIDSLPDRALRYLILHELAHLRVHDHSPKFWALVEEFEPDWKRWRRVAQGHFIRAAQGEPAPDGQIRPAACRTGDPGPAPDGQAGDAGKAGPAVAKALFDELTGPHGFQLALFSEFAAEYPI